MLSDVEQIYNTPEDFDRKKSCRTLKKEKLSASWRKCAVVLRLTCAKKKGRQLKQLILVISGDLHD